MNQFVYTSKVGDKTFKASFNINKVIRTMSLETGELAVILDDFHEQLTQQPDVNPKTNKVNGYKNVRTTMQSEIILPIEDADRFFNLLNIETNGK